MVAIYKEDDEATREGKRRINKFEMGEEHRIGALSLPTGIPKNCKIYQPREEAESYKLKEED